MDVKAASVTKRFGLSGNALKVIAIIAMTIDHVAWMRIEAYEQAEVPLQIFLHCIGRLTAPIMFFLLLKDITIPGTSGNMLAGWRCLLWSAISLSAILHSQVSIPLRT